MQIGDRIPENLGIDQDGKEISKNVKQNDGNLTVLTYHHYPWKHIIKQYEALF